MSELCRKCGAHISEDTGDLCANCVVVDQPQTAEEQLKGALGAEFKVQFGEAVAQAALAAAGSQGRCVATGVTEHGVTGTVLPETFMGAELHAYVPPSEFKARPEHYLTRRLGRFYISSDVLRHFPEEAQHILMNCVVVRAEQRFDLDGVEYIAMCAQFRERKPGEDVPEYVVLMRREGDTVLFDRFVPYGEDQKDSGPAA